MYLTKYEWGSSFRRQFLWEENVQENREIQIGGGGDSEQQVKYLV